MKPSNCAIIIIDIQNDFFSGGALPANDTGPLVSNINEFTQFFLRDGFTFVFTRDWHPSNHSSFKTEGGLWVPHCVQNTWGAEFVDGLYIPCNSLIIDKGVSPSSIGYSDFEDTKLDSMLRKKGIELLVICGVATEYCVLENVKDAIRLGYSVVVIEDLIRPVEANLGDEKEALIKMRELGVNFHTKESWQKNYYK